MARKGRKTRWRKLPIPIGNNQGETSCAAHNVPNNLEPEHPHQHPSSPSPKEQVSRVTFNEDEYTKITTPRQDMLFKKGYLSKKRPQPQEQQPSFTSPEPSQSPSDSVESEQYIGCDEASPYPPPFVYPTGYMDPNGLFYLNGGSYEVYDPYTNSVTVIVGPGSGYPGQPVLAAVPCHPLPLQPIEWFNPPPQHQPNNFKKRNSTDSQNWGSSQSCESPSSGQELETPDSSLYYPQPQYIYPGYMFGAPLYNINGVSVQGAAPPPPQHQAPQHATCQNQPSLHQPQPADQPKRRKKRRKRRRPGMGDEGSESSCEEVAGSGVSSDAGQGSSCSKTTDSGIHTGADSPQPQSSPVPVHDSPLPDASTEEEPSQPSISQIPCITLNNHLTTDSSTEDEANEQPCDASLKELVVSTEHINIAKSTNQLEVLETELKEETVKELPVVEKITERFDKVSPEDQVIVENGIEHEIIPKKIGEKSDEWVNTNENGLENEGEPSYIMDTIQPTNCLSSDKGLSFIHEEASFSSEKPCLSPEKPCLSPEKPCQSPEKPCLSPEEPCLPPEEPSLSPEEPCLSPEEPCLSPEEPCLSPENLCLSPEEPCLSPEKPCLSLEEPCLSLEEPCSSLEEPCLYSEEPCSSLEEPCLSSEEPCLSPEKPCIPQEESCLPQEEPCLSLEEPCFSSEEHSFSPEEPSSSPEKLSFSTPDELPCITSEEPSCLSPEKTSSFSIQETPSISLKESSTFSLEDAPLILLNGPDANQVYIEETVIPDCKEELEECIAEETGYSEEGWGSAEETSVEERWALAELGEEVTVDKPITEAVTRWLESQGTKALVPHPPIESEDEGIGEETPSPTGPKNVKGNPCLVRYPSTETRVAADLSKCESEVCAWRAKCDPMVSVDRYYRLGADLPPTAPAFKTATAHPTIMHIDPSIPFPCGLVCCILQ